MPTWIAVGLTLATAAVISSLIETLNHWPLERKRATSGAHLVSSLGIYLVWSQAVLIFWGDQSRYFHEGASGTFSVFGVPLTSSQAIQAAEGHRSNLIRVFL
jgi:branched-subunit amino acid ABC-type transport system permease component